MAITTAGKAEFVNLLGNLSSPVAWGWLAVGDGTTAAVIGDTTLESELYRGAATVDIVSVLSPYDTLLFWASLDATASKTISEVGIFNDASAGDLLARYLPTKTKAVTSGQKITILFYVSVKSGSAGSGSGY